MRSKPWEEFWRATDAPDLEFVFTVCDNATGEICPTWPGPPMTAHWGLPDPAEANGAAAEIGPAFADAYRMLGARIDPFIYLPFENLDRLSLQKRMEDIGPDPEPRGAERRMRPRSIEPSAVTMCRELA
ncbi:MAG: hypothetical protein H0X27_07935 [Caulobacteraceae bacterium]|nr:hypothetical protein [Caulobacteraceae bacterium]